MKDRWSNIKRIIFVLSCCIVVLILPWLLTRNCLSHIAAFGPNTGPIGDTIGGLTAPFIGLLSAILVYISFQEQVKANRLVQVQITEETLRRNLQESFEKIERLKGELRENTFDFIEGLTLDIHTLVNFQQAFENNDSTMLDLFNNVYGKGATLNSITSIIFRDKKNKVDQLNVLYGYIFHHFNYLHRAAIRTSVDKNEMLLDFITLNMEEFNAYVSYHFEIKSPIDETMQFVSHVLKQSKEINLLNNRIKQIKSIQLKADDFLQ